MHVCMCTYTSDEIVLKLISRSGGERILKNPTMIEIEFKISRFKIVNGGFRFGWMDERREWSRVVLLFLRCN